MAETREVIVDVTIKGNSDAKAKEVTTAVQNIKKESKDASKQFGVMDTDAGKAFKGMKENVGGFINSLKGVKSAIAATGIGLLVIAAGALFDIFRKMEIGPKLWNNIKDALVGTTEQYDKLKEKAKEYYESLISDAEYELKLLAAKKVSQDVLYEQRLKIANLEIQAAEKNKDNATEELKTLAKKGAWLDSILLTMFKTVRVSDDMKKVSEDIKKADEEIIAGKQNLLILEAEINTSSIEQATKNANEKAKLEEDLNNKKITSVDNMYKSQEKLAEDWDAYQWELFEKELEDNVEKDEIRTEQFLEQYEALQEIKDELRELEVESEDEAYELEKTKIEERRAADLARYGDTEEAKLLINKRYNKEREKLDKLYLKMKEANDLQVLSSTANLFGEVSKLMKEGSAEQKAFAIIEATINTLVGVTKALADPGGLLGIITAATVLVSGMATVAEISSQPTKALGGWIGGASHQDGGVNINAEAGEFVVNKRAMANPQIASQVMAFNNAGNGDYNGSGGMLSQEDVAAIAAQVVASIPVYVVESEITDMQRKVEVREARFSR